LIFRKEKKMKPWKACSDSEKIERLGKAVFILGDTLAHLQAHYEKEKHKSSNFPEPPFDNYVDSMHQALCKIIGQKFLK